MKIYRNRNGGVALNNSVRRILVEKKPGFDTEAQHLYLDLKDNLGITGLKQVRIVNRYDISGISDEAYNQAKKTIFSEPNVDFVYDEAIEIKDGLKHFAKIGRASCRERVLMSVGGG